MKYIRIFAILFVLSFCTSTVSAFDLGITMDDLNLEVSDEIKNLTLEPELEVQEELQPLKSYDAKDVDEKD